MKAWIKIAIRAATALGLLSEFFDDMKCESFGYRKRTPDYAKCWLTLEAARQSRPRIVDQGPTFCTHTFTGMGGTTTCY